MLNKETFFSDFKERKTFVILPKIICYFGPLEDINIRSLVFSFRITVVCGYISKDFKTDLFQTACYNYNDRKAIF